MTEENWWEVSIPVREEEAEEAANALAKLTGRGVAIVPASSFSTVVAYLPATTPAEKLLRFWAEGERWAAGKIEVRRLQEKDWLTWWRREYHPFRVGKRLVIKPTWAAYEPGPGEVVIELDPGLAFGCGTHPTTRICLRLLEKWLRPGMKVYDVGTGSGILAIAAALLGADWIWAIDEDEVALRVARENVARNGVADRVQVLRGNLLEGKEEKADLIVANLTAELILQLLPQAAKLLLPGGLLIAGGIPVERKGEVLSSSPLVLVEELAEEGWVGLVLSAR
ncbi:ribosomal protein L11 methyltransferase [Ammonifex degensii KC4]|uniref:Ribosomal protein L11 methyltransferase n=1 Tax=Ammonifex degensii (strain DSM 10501 / KC4) TaxID=429009 RepID=C9RBY0_AMMDK|nr:50S ribosomal protein L11 methyltransferase [Ammonifex degensii]ACX51757.1 ribosomal protein L11 methyltransferase [Ammonifex degensii KC4]